MKKVSDYIVEFLIDKGITNVFGYPGGMVTNLMESFSKHQNKITNHINYHEQACAFAACAYAQVNNSVGIAYATSGPGATNLITGICQAYFDSIPVIFITGQVNVNERNKPNMGRQKGFQETNITEMVKPVTKYCKYIDNENKIKYYLEKAFSIAKSDRPGPVLLDIPMNIFKCMIDEKNLTGYTIEENNQTNFDRIAFTDMLKDAKRPCILCGNGIKLSNSVKKFRKFVKIINIPVVSSMLAVDVLEKNNPLNYGFLGAYGNREANYIIAKSDLIITMGSRLDIRQIGAKKENFAPHAKLIRIDIDENELNNRIKEDEIQIVGNINNVLSELLTFSYNFDYSNWINICNDIKNSLKNIDKNTISLYVQKISDFIPDDSIITTDVGQNQVWIAQHFNFKKNQKVLFSGGLGAMGYSLPAAIGAHYGSKKPVFSFSGDGGFQMNIQELQFIKSNKLPITIFIFNNHALGMIRHFQEMYFNGNYAYTKEGNGYSTPNFKKIAKAYELDYLKIRNLSDITKNIIGDAPKIIEIDINENTYVFPKIEFGKPNQDQEPLIDRDLYNRLMEL